MFENVDEIRETRKQYNHRMFQSGVRTFRELEQLEANAFQPGSLAQKYKELIALGLSIGHGCYG